VRLVSRRALGWRRPGGTGAALPVVVLAFLPAVLASPPPSARAAGSAETASPPAAKATGGGAAVAAPGIADRYRENKLLVRRYLTEVLAGGKLEKLDEIVAKTFVDRSPGAADLHGAAAVRQAQKKLRSLFSKLEYNPQELTAEDDRVAARYLVVATPRAEPGGPPPPPLVLNGVALFRVRDGRIQEVFVLNDQVGLLRQLGYSLVPPGAGGPPAGSAVPPPAAARPTPPAAEPPPG
jgi:predicted ester cyclase